MPVRHAQFAGPFGFYPDDPDTCRRQVQQCLRSPADPGTTDALPERLVAGIAPHAGWVYSGPTAGVTFRLLQERSRPATVVMAGACHRVTGRHTGGIVMAEGRWETPLGPLAVDEAFAAALIERGVADDGPEVHSHEHSLEVMTPFVKACFPQAGIVPVMIPPDDRAPSVGEAIAEVASQLDRPTVVVASTDLTHYGPDYGFTPAGLGPPARDWVLKDNDGRLLELIRDLDAEAIVPEAMRSRSACGAGAVAATITAARGLGARRGHVVAHTLSCEVRPDPAHESFVGYAAVVF